MDKMCEIEAKIKKIVAAKNNHNDYANKVFKILKPHIAEYRKFELDNGLLPEYYRYHPQKISIPEPKISLEEAVESISKQPFICWLNKQEGFLAAKRKILEEKLVVISNPGVESIRSYRNSFSLEFVCALIIHYFADDENKLKQVVVTKPKIKPIDVALKKLRFELKKGGGLYFRCESKQHLLQYLLDDLVKEDNKNVYSELKNHENISRHLLTKKIMQALFTIYGKECISQATVVDIALNLTAIFYTNPMDRRDALTDANKILHNIAEDEKFKQQTIAEILAPIGLEAMTF